MEAQAVVILGVLLLTGLVWLMKTSHDTKQEVAVLRTILVGADGLNGIKGEVQMLRARTHATNDAVHAIAGKLGLFEMREQDRHDRRDDKP